MPPAKPWRADVAQHGGVHAAGLALAVAALVAAVRPAMGDADAGRHAELADHHGLAAVVGAKRRQQPGVGVATAAVGGGQPQEVGVVRIGVVAREESARPGCGGGHVHGVDRDHVLRRQRLVAVVQRVGREPVGEGHRPAPATRGLERRPCSRASRPASSPSAWRRRWSGSSDRGTARRPALARSLARVAAGPTRSRATRPAATARRRCGSGRPHGRARGQVGVAVDDGDRVSQLRPEAVADRPAVGVAGAQELLLGDPDALDHANRAAGVGEVVGAHGVVEGGSQDRVDAHHADAEVAHPGQPAVVVGAGGGHLAGLMAGRGGAQVDAGPEARLEAAAADRLDRGAVHARGQPQAVDRDRRRRPGVVRLPRSTAAEDEGKRDGGKRAQGHRSCDRPRRQRLEPGAGAGRICGCSEYSLT